MRVKMRIDANTTQSASLPSLGVSVPNILLANSRFVPYT